MCVATLASTLTLAIAPTLALSLCATAGDGGRERGGLPTGSGRRITLTLTLTLALTQPSPSPRTLTLLTHPNRDHRSRRRRRPRQAAQRGEIAASGAVAAERRHGEATRELAISRAELHARRGTQAELLELLASREAQQRRPRRARARLA